MSEIHLVILAKMRQLKHRFIVLKHFKAIKNESLTVAQNLHVSDKSLYDQYLNIRDSISHDPHSSLPGCEDRL